jgi:hypothetical protein
LNVHGTRLEASFIIQALSRWDLNEEQKDSVRELTFEWLNMHAEALEARWLITTLLRPRRTLSTQEVEAYGVAAQRWLARHGKNIDAVLLIAYCLNSDQPELARQAANSGTAWLARHSAGQLTLEDHGGRTLAGIYARLAPRLLALAAAIWHNWATGAPVKRSLNAYDH